MERKKSFTQRNFYQYKNNLSPFGQKIFNVLLNNCDKEKHCGQNRFNNGGDPRNGQKKILLNFDDSSTSRLPLFSQSEHYNSNRNSYYNNTSKDISTNDYDVGYVPTTYEFFSNDTARYDDNVDLPSEPNARVLQFTSTKNNPKEDVLNITVTGLGLSPPVQNNAEKNNQRTLSLEINPNMVGSDVTFTNINKKTSSHEENSDIISAGLLPLPSNQNNKKDRHNMTSLEPVLKPGNDCNANVTSGSLLQFHSIQNVNKESRSNINPTISVLLDSVQRTSKDDITDDDRTLGFFDFSPVKGNSEEEGHSVCTLDMLRPLESNRSIKPEQPHPDLVNKSLDFFTIEQSTPKDPNQARHMMKNNVLWTDMFDSELLPNDVVAPAVKNNIINEQKVSLNQKQFKITFPKENTKKEARSVKNKGENKCRPVKRKKEITFNNEMNSKKLKETDLNTKKNKVRKEKYTKTVKKGLGTVDPSNISETEHNQEHKNKDPSELLNSDKTVDKKVVESDNTLANNALVPKKQKETKKVIQARLANKGGIMKFDKPEALQEDGKDEPSDATSAETTSNVTNRVSLKKGKTKFVAPLKSQIPVKEIEFNVVVVDQDNANEHLTKLQNLNTIEVFAVLTYSNGFCQLNKQFTEDDCTPDGVMLLIGDDFYYFQKTADAFSDVIIKFMKKHTVVCYGGKHILIFFKHHFDIEFNVCIHDIQIGGSLLEPDSPPESFGALQKLANCTPQYTVATTCSRQKAAWYLTLLRDCAEKLKSKLVDNSLWSLFQDIEMPVLPCIAEMEFHGILVDTDLLQRMQAVSAACAAAAGRPLALGSPAQLAAVLYDQLQLHTRANLHVRDTLAKGRKSTSEDMLRLLVPLHPLPALVLEYRRLHKAHATFLAGIRQHVRDGLLKPTWVQTAAATGRVASNNPNVQAIPKAPFSLSSDTDKPEEALNLRSVYVARPGHVLLSADFRQVECRVFAAAAADGVLLAALHSGRDLFTVLAAQWLKKSEEEVTAADRERTKRIVYASLYGAGLRRLMAILHVSYDQAASISASFHRTFPSLKCFEQSVCRACSGGRAARTPAGRAPQPPPRPARARTATGRQLPRAGPMYCFLCAGTAADVCKVAMARAHDELRAADVQGRLLLQIHDELVWELPAQQLPRAHAVVRAAMSGSGPRAGRSWGQLHDLPDLPDPPPASHAGAGSSTDSYDQV